jgi:hypothetical protein
VPQPTTLPRAPRVSFSEDIYVLEYNIMYSTERQPSSAFYLNHAVLLFGLFLATEDWGFMFLQNMVDFQRTMYRYILGDRNLHNHPYENLKTYI